MRWLILVLLLALVGCATPGGIEDVQEADVSEEDPEEEPGIFEEPVQIGSQTPLEPEEEVEEPPVVVSWQVDRVLAQGSFYQDDYVMNRMRVELSGEEFVLEDIIVNVTQASRIRALSYNASISCARPVGLFSHSQHFAAQPTNSSLVLCFATPRTLSAGSQIVLEISYDGELWNRSFRMPSQYTSQDHQIYP